MEIEENVPFKSASELCREIVKKFKVGNSSIIEGYNQSVFRSILDQIVKKSKSDSRFKIKTVIKNEKFRIWRIK